MACEKSGCKREYPKARFSITSADGICFPCRTPHLWTEGDEASYRKALAEVKPAKQEKKES